MSTTTYYVPEKIYRQLKRIVLKKVLGRTIPAPFCEGKEAKKNLPEKLRSMLYRRSFFFFFDRI